jgi:hypothetical protein
MHRWAPSRSLEILFQRLFMRFGWGMVLLSSFQLVTRLLSSPSPQRRVLIISSGLAIPIWLGLTLWYRSLPPTKDRSDAFALAGIIFVGIQVSLVTWFLRDPMRLVVFFILLSVSGIFVRRVRTYLLCQALVLAAAAFAWIIAPPPAASSHWVFTQLILALGVGGLVHQLMRSLLYRVGHLLARLVEARRAMAELRSLIPICAACKSIRNDKGFWETVETYVERHTHSALTHGLCPTCLAAAREDYHRSLQADPPR